MISATPPPGVTSLNPGRPSAADRQVLATLAAQAELELRQNILPFWLNHTRDRARGGFFGVIGNDLKVRKEAPRGLLLTARILWAFSAAHRTYRDPEYLEMAKWAYDDLRIRFLDPEHGGVFWTVSAAGKPLERRKQIYAQAFAIYGLSEYHRACGDPEALEQAIAIYRAVEAHAYDSAHGGYFEAYARDWRALPKGTRSLMATDEPKSQNTMLHIMEAYTNLLRVWPDAGLRHQLTELVERMATRVRNPDSNHLHLLLGADWAPRSHEISFGHDIEFSWLLAEAAEVLGDPVLIERMKPISVAIARVTQAQAFDGDGGMFNEAGPKGLTDASKHWWPQAESTVGFLNAYQLTGEPEFLQTCRRSWEFIATQMVDREHGEWFWARDPKGRVLERMPKVSTWKCPYHNGRACMELVERSQKLLAGPAAKLE
ncbi:MAG: AGE family epimerase/isomerase [Opitutaceae bacterium]|nr:AGE family epimerase/isomerase [Opitutaceae bacterium]